MKFDVYEPTMLQFFTLCPEKFYLRYIEGLEPSSSLALFKGLIGHQVLGNPDESLDEIFHAAVSNYRAGILRPRFDLPFDQEWELHDAITQSVTSWYRYVNARGIEILEREKFLDFDFCERRFHGTVDIIYRTPTTPVGKVCIGDYKFGRRQSDRQLDRNIQHALYYVGLSKLGYQIHHNAWISMNDLMPYKADGKKGKKGDNRGQVIYPIEITADDLPMIEEEVSRLLSYIDHGVRFKASYGVDAPCVTCEYANQGCRHFKIGRNIQYNQDTVDMSQAVKEKALLKAMMGDEE